jgi:type IV secretion system protein VirB11
LLDQGKTFEFLATAVKNQSRRSSSPAHWNGQDDVPQRIAQGGACQRALRAIEDTPEIQLHHQNAVGLVAVRGKLGEASVTPADLLEAALRLRPTVSSWAKSGRGGDQLAACCRHRPSRFDHYRPRQFTRWRD